MPAPIVPAPSTAIFSVIDAPSFRLRVAGCRLMVTVYPQPSTCNLQLSITLANASQKFLFNLYALLQAGSGDGDPTGVDEGAGRSGEGDVFLEIHLPEGVQHFKDQLAVRTRLDIVGIGVQQEGSASHVCKGAAGAGVFPVDYARAGGR